MYFNSHFSRQGLETEQVEENWQKVFAESRSCSQTFLGIFHIAGRWCHIILFCLSSLRGVNSLSVGLDQIAKSNANRFAKISFLLQERSKGFGNVLKSLAVLTDKFKYLNYLCCVSWIVAKSRKQIPYLMVHHFRGFGFCFASLLDSCLPFRL